MAHSPEQVVPRILAALDDHRFEDLRELYTEDVQARTAVGDLSGAAQVIDMLRRFHEPIPALQHLMSGLVLDVDANRDHDAATFRANVISIFCDAERRPAFEGASVWRGRLQRVSDRWRLAELTIASVWSRGAPPGP